MPLGQARLTSAGRLPFKAIVHVAGIDLLWRASEQSIRDSVRSTMDIVAAERFASVAFPVIGAGSGGFREADALAAMRVAFASVETAADVRIVRYRPSK